MKLIYIIILLSLNIWLAFIELQFKLPFEYFIIKILLLISITYIPKLWKANGNNRRKF